MFNYYGTTIYGDLIACIYIILNVGLIILYQMLFKILYYFRNQFSIAFIFYFYFYFEKPTLMLKPFHVAKLFSEKSGRFSSNGAIFFFLGNKNGKIAKQTFSVC